MKSVWALVVSRVYIKRIPIESDSKRREMARERERERGGGGQRNPCCRYALMMMMIITHLQMNQISAFDNQ